MVHFWYGYPVVHSPLWVIKPLNGEDDENFTSDLVEEIWIEDEAYEEIELKMENRLYGIG